MVANKTIFSPLVRDAAGALLAGLQSSLGRKWALRVSAPALLCLAAAGAFSQTVTTRIPTGSKPGASAINPVTNKIYVAIRHTQRLQSDIGVCIQ